MDSSFEVLVLQSKGQILYLSLSKQHMQLCLESRHYLGHSMSTGESLFLLGLELERRQKIIFFSFTNY